MHSMNRRVVALESGRSVELSPAVRAWLGWPVTDAERVAIDRGDYDVTGEQDTSNWSKEMREWLGAD